MTGCDDFHVKILILVSESSQLLLVVKLKLLCVHYQSNLDEISDSMHM